MALDGEVLGPEAETVDPDDEAKVRRKFWPTLKKAARHIPFTQDVVAAYYCAIDPAVPLRVRGTLLGALLYFVTPLDAVPDFILGLGFTDDATVLLGAITLVAAHITTEHRQRAEKALAD
ncbi:DUF1232 domain-containing protein [Acuticoccus kandeliae]|uniref:YkvA family protein n=1 Tax=Acuticoccus kandeliae TaxID=2073160 RepID=UPI00196A4DBB